MERKSASALGYGIAFTVGAALVLWGALQHAPTEPKMGDVQRIFYFHVPSAMNAALAFVLTGIAGIGFLATRRDTWDRLGRVMNGTGVLWATCVIVTGPIWARSSWGTYWQWEPRLTTSFVVWLIYLGCLLVRRVSNDPEQGARLGAVIAIVGLPSLPLVYFAVKLWRNPTDLHPQRVAMDPQVALSLALGALGVTLIHLVMVGLSWRVTRLADEVAAAERRLDEEGGLR